MKEPLTSDLVHLARLVLELNSFQYQDKFRPTFHVGGICLVRKDKLTRKVKDEVKKWTSSPHTHTHTEYTV